MATVVCWREWDGEGLEHCAYRLDETGLMLEGVVAGTHEGLYGGHYLVRTDAAVRTRDVRVAFVGGPALRLLSDGEGGWRDAAAGRSLPELDGCVDVDIRITPATNTLPIRRLGLAVGESREIAVAYVPLPDGAGGLRPKRVMQRYTRLDGEGRYRYEGLDSGFSADIEVDAAGLVLDYPGVFRRLRRPMND